MARSHPGTGNIVPMHAPPAVHDPALPADQRSATLLGALPDRLQAILTSGITRRACFDGADGFSGLRETWSPPAAVDPADADDAIRALAEIEGEILAPVDPGWLLARLLALFAHCPPRSAPLDPVVERMVAGDWAEDLGEYPQWAVDQAARLWRRTRKWRPTITEMRALCDEAVAAERSLADQLRRIAAASVPPTARVEARSVQAIAGRAIRRM